jgi:hypothetical protein
MLQPLRRTAAMDLDISDKNHLNQWLAQCDRAPR